jgi:hypothetical protein
MREDIAVLVLREGADECHPERSEGSPTGGQWLALGDPSLRSQRTSSKFMINKGWPQG